MLMTSGVAGRFGSTSTSSMRVLVLPTEGGLSMVEISAGQAGAVLPGLLDDPVVARRCALPGLEFWVGDSAPDGEVNRGASLMLMLLLQDVAAGKYELDVVSRARAAQQLASTDWAKVIRGTCVVTGLDDAGVVPAPLGEPFWRWLGLVLVEAHDYGKTEAAQVIAACLGLEIDFGPGDPLPGLRGLESR